MADDYSFGTLSAEDEKIPAPTSETIFRIAVLGDFSGRGNRGEVGSSEEVAGRRGYKISRENLDEMMAKMGVKLELPAGEGGEKATLSFASLDDFHPDQVHGNVERFSDLSDSDEKTALMNALLHHPDFQALESAWRGLDWMLRRAQKGGQVDVVLYDIAFAELQADVGEADDLAKSGLYTLLIEKGSRGPRGEPWALVVGNYLFEPTVKHAELLARLAKIARHTAAPVLAGVEPRVLDKSFALGEADAPAWEALRKLPEAALLGLALPRFLVRLPYGENTQSIDRFSYEEFAGVSGPKPYLWGNAALAEAALVAQGFQKEGWAFKPGAVLDLPDMAMHVYREDDEEQATVAEAWLARQQSEQLGKLGFIVLLCVKGSNAMQLLRFTSLAAPPKGKQVSDFVGRWGQKGVVKMPSSAPPLSVGVGMMSGPAPAARPVAAARAPAAEEDAAGAPAEEAAAPTGGDEMDPELAALMADLETPAAAAPAEAPAGGDEMDPELAALMKDLETPAAEAPKEAAPAGGDEMDPELAALMKELETPAEEPKTEAPAATAEEAADPELAALMKELEAPAETATAEAPTESADDKAADDELAALMKELETPAEPPAPPSEGADPDLDALMKELEGGGSTEDAEAKAETDPELADLMKQLEGS